MHKWPYIISATKLRRHIMCARRPFMDEHGDLRDTVEPVGQRALFARGYMLETEVEEEIRAGTHGTQVAAITTIPKSRSPRAAIVQTLAEMKNGQQTIAQGLLQHDNWWGCPDWLHRTDGDSVFGPWHYIPGDAKLGNQKSSQAAQIVPIAYYALLLERVQGLRPKTFRIYRGGAAQTLSVDDHVHAVLMAIDELSDTLGKKHDPGPHLTSECVKCPWHVACERDARERSHLTLITGMRRSTIPKLKALGITTVTDLARAPISLVRTLPTLGGPNAGRTLAQAKSYESGRPFMITPPALPEPAGTEIFLDIEGEGRNNATDAFLFGLLIRRGRKVQYWNALADTHRGGRTAWRQLCKKLRTLPASSPILHFGQYDRQLIFGLNAMHGGGTEVLPRLVDVHAAIASHVVLPARGTSLKTIAGALGFTWSEVGDTGRATSDWWLDWTLSRSRTARRRLLGYNEDDLRALAAVVDWARATEEHRGAT